MVSDIFDTYFYLLENPGLRQLGLAEYQIKYATPHFDKQVYQSSSGRVFESVEEAYKDWLSGGRQEGFEWAEGKDTLLKIVLKAKDELELLDAWISHHSEIVGYENLIILDCGSTDPAYLRKLQAYRSRVLIFDYKRYYDHIHSTRSNASFFNFIGRNCRYVTVLDADEFLIAKHGSYFSKNFVKQILRQQSHQIFCGIWLNTVEPGALIDSVFDRFSKINIDVSSEALLAGAVAGKAIANTNILMEMGHLGHNLHSPDVLPFVSGQSFGHLFIVHVKNLDRAVTKARALRHLVAKGAMSGVLASEIEEEVSALSRSANTTPDIRGYAQIYMQAGQVPLTTAADVEVATVSLVGQNPPEAIALLDRSLSRLDFSELVTDKARAFQKEVTP